MGVKSSCDSDNRWDDYNEDWLELTMNVKRLKNKEAHHPFVGTWHICEMEMWEEDYFNMETQAYVNIQADNLGDFQFGLVTGCLDGYLEQENSQERFAFTWEGQDEMDEVSGCGWIKLSDKNEVEGVISLHGRDRSRFKAKRARNVGYSG